MSNILSTREKYIEIENLIIKSEGVITEEIQELINTLDDDLKNTIIFFCKKRRESVLLKNNLEQRLAMISDKISRLDKNVNYWENKVDQMMKIGNYTNLDLDEFSIHYRPTSKVVIVDEKKIPEEYMRTPPVPPPPLPVPDKVNIGKALKNGHTIPGALLDTTPILKIE